MPTVTAGGVSTWYEETGQGSPLVLIHGLGASSRDWEPQVAVLAGTHRVITYDVCGHGRSAKPPGPYHLAAFGRQAAELIEAVAHGPAHVVGLSMGGMIGFQLAVDRPDLLASLTIVNSGPELVPRNWQERLALWLRVATVRWLGLERMGAILAERLFPEPDQAAGRAQFLARFLENDRDAYLAATKALIGWRVTDRIGAIPCPVLVVASDRDYTPPSRKEEYVRLLPNARMVVIPDAHHAVTAERPEAFNEVLTTFLASLPA